MNVRLPNALETAQREAAAVNAHRDEYLAWPLDRIIADSPFVERARLVAGLEAFHRERMARIPPASRYPEAVPWVDYVIRVDRELQRLTGMSGLDMALYRSLHAYVLFRGFYRLAPPSVEKCRVAYVPDSDHGQIHIKNVDDPNTYWKPEARPAWLFPQPEQTLFSDGVGNGLHMDDEPAEIFPLPVMQMYPLYSGDVPGAVGFLRRYSPFWGRANLLLHDRQKRAAAIEKCSFNFFEVFEPGPDGAIHISGMTCRDPNSPQGRFQRAQREKYLRLFGLPPDGPDSAFWAICRQCEEKLAGGLCALGRPAQLESLLQLFTRPWPAGLNKTGQRIHKDQGLLGYTLISYAILYDEKRLLRWQRSALPECRYPDSPEEFSW
mgnify:CR=1 FL=1